jgi:hypothetical protein
MSIAQFFSVFLRGLVTGISCSHFLQRGPKKTLQPAQFLAVQQVLLRNYGPAVGGLELGAFVATLAMAIVGWNQATVRTLAILASACVLAMVIIWAVWINPTVNSWTPESIPSEWTEFRDRWHALHAVRLILSAIGFTAVITASLALCALPRQ